MLIKNLNIPWVVIISMDSFYRALNAEEKKEVAAGNYDFDHPNAFDFGLLKDTLLKIKSG
jgi:uridine kinase